MPEYLCDSFSSDVIWITRASDKALNKAGEVLFVQGETVIALPTRANHWKVLGQREI
jgi:hypothetical protein